MTVTDEPTPNASRPTASPAEVLLRVACLAGLAVSAMLLVDYVRPPVFCADRGTGCDLVRASAYARPGGIPLPVPGMVFFATLLGVSLVARGRQGRAALGVLGALGVGAGLTLVAIQHFRLQAWCRYCLVVDAASMIAGGIAIALSRNEIETQPRYARWGSLGLAAAVLPLFWGLSRPSHHPARPAPLASNVVPEVILREQRPGVATVVEFVDFECPFCRRQQEALVTALASYGPRVRVVRKNVPLSFHPHARDAARAHCCADEQGRGDAMADALFRAEDLTPEGCERVARGVGVDLGAYRACLASPRPNVAVERDERDARAVGLEGLPTIWIGREHFVGLQTIDTLRASIDRALAASSRRGT